MCATCGCSAGDAGVTISGHGHGHDQAHPHPPDSPRLLEIERDILAKNDLLAARNRDWLAAERILALNLMSSPGSGKTTLLERTIADVGDELEIAVIEGDQETPLDSERIRAAGRPAVQINTGSGCHLDAEMLARALGQLRPPTGSVVLIENVGNLVCPALFDLGERAKVVIMSVTEGDDKPLKYPHIFQAAELLILNKIDLLPYVSFDPVRCVCHARRVKPSLAVLEVSATRGDGMPEWYAWLRAQHQVAR